jgi:hypothetical protein
MLPAPIIATLIKIISLKESRCDVIDTTTAVTIKPKIAPELLRACYAYCSPETYNISGQFWSSAMRALVAIVSGLAFGTLMFALGSLALRPEEKIERPSVTLPRSAPALTRSSRPNLRPRLEVNKPEAVRWIYRANGGAKTGFDSACKQRSICF